MCKSQVFGTGLESFKRNSKFWIFKFSMSYLRKTAHLFTFWIFSTKKNRVVNYPTWFLKTTWNLLQIYIYTFSRTMFFDLLSQLEIWVFHQNRQYRALIKWIFQILDFHQNSLKNQCKSMKIIDNLIKNWNFWKIFFSSKNYIKFCPETHFKPTVAIVHRIIFQNENHFFINLGTWDCLLLA